METINLKVDKTKKYIIACSYGPDSMALLDASIKNNLDIVVAHVNYRKRDVSVFEQKNLEKFCDDHKIKIHVLDLLKAKPTKNFQDWARKVRYEFFKRVLDEEGADAVLIAHQEDDLIETYIMQKNRGNYAKIPGISRENNIFGIKVIRPLLGYSKKELQEYNNQNNVPYSIDQSNLSDIYTRNRIRHDVVEKMSKAERTKIIKEIENVSKVNVTAKSTYEYYEFKKMSYETIVCIIDYFMRLTNIHRDLSNGYISEIKKAFSSKSTHRVEITNALWLEKDYDEIYFINATKVKPYEEQFLKKVNLPFITIDFSCGAADRGIKNTSNLIIKNLNKNDEIIIKDYASKISRLFIDWKMPLFLREIWPGIYDQNSKLIYVPRYRKEFTDCHSSKFEIKTDYFLEF